MTDPIENVTVNQGYQLPAATNPTAVDVERLIAAITAVDNDIALLFAAVLVRAGLDSPNFTGTPTAPTQPAGTNNNTVATTGHVQLALNAFLSEAASALETISALEAALGDADLATALLDQLALKAPLASPTFTGTPIAPTAATETSTGQLATTAFVQAVKALVLGAPPSTLDTLQKIAAAIGNNPSFSTDTASALALKAPLASPALTGTPTAPTAPLGDTSTKLATTGFVQAAIGSYDTGLTATLAAKAPLASPALSGTPTAPTPAAGNNTTQVATTAFVTAADSALNTSITAALGLKAPLASPAFTGTPTAPTQAAGNNTTRIATTAFVTAADDALSAEITTALAAKAPLASPTFTGTVALPSTTSIGTITSTELGYVDGVTSSIQTQLNGKASTSHTHADWNQVSSALAGMTAGGVGSLALAYLNSLTTAIVAGNTYTGIRQINIAANDTYITSGGLASSNLGGTWRALTNVEAVSTRYSVGLFVRIA